MDWVQGLLASLQNPNTGGGSGSLPQSATEILKAVMAVNNSNSKLGELTSGDAGAGSLVNAALPIYNATTNAGAAPGATAPLGGGMMDKISGAWTKFTDALADPNAAAGWANTFGTLGSAIAKPGTWQDRTGKAAAGLGQNAVAADRFTQILNALKLPPNQAPNTPAPGAPTSIAPVATAASDLAGGAPGATSNFHRALLANPWQ